MSLLVVKDIHTYYGPSHVLYGVSLHVDKSETVALLGRNGAGKTTTIHSITGQTPPRRGKIRFKGQRIDGKEPYQVAATGIGLVPEDRRVYKTLTVADNLEVVKRDSGWSLDRIYNLFPRLEKRSNNLGHHLSGGEQQMLTIARALVTGPDLLLLDEPSKGLAPAIVDDVRDLISDITDEGITVLLTEQETRLALDLSDRVYAIEDGMTKWEGTASEFEDQDIGDKYIGVSDVDADFVLD